MTGLAPSFEPGSGWVHPDVSTMSFNDEARAQYLAASWVGHMVPLRRAGPRVLARELLTQPFARVGIVCTMALTWWNAQAHKPGDCFNATSVLVNAQLQKRSDSNRLYTGWQPQGNAGEFVLQSWLCGTTEAAVRAVLELMVVQEETKDPNAKHPRGITRTSLI